MSVTSMNVTRMILAVDFTPGVGQRMAWVLRDIFPGAEPIFVYAVARAGDDASPRAAAAIETTCLGATARIRELADSFGIPTPRWSVEVGDPADVISNAALVWGANLVVVGPHEAKRWASPTANTVERIVQLSRRPVLVVQGWPVSVPRHVVLAVESTERVPRNVSTWMQWLYSRFHTRFHAIHGITGAIPVTALAREDAQRAWESRGEGDGEGDARLPASYLSMLAALGIPENVVTLDSDWDDAVGAVLGAAEREASDLIIVGESHHGALGRVLHGSVTRAIVEGAGRPVLVVPTDDSLVTGSAPRA